MKPQKPYYDKPRTGGSDGRTSGGGAHLDAPVLRRRSAHAEGADAYQEWLGEDQTEQAYLRAPEIAQGAALLAVRTDRLRRQVMSSAEATETAESFRLLSLAAGPAAGEDVAAFTTALALQVDRLARQVMSEPEARAIAERYERLYFRS